MLKAFIPRLTDEIIVNLQDLGQEDTRQWAHTFATLVAYLKSLPEMVFWENFFPFVQLLRFCGEMRPETMEHGFLVGWPNGDTSWIRDPAILPPRCLWFHCKTHIPSHGLTVEGQFYQCLCSQLWWAMDRWTICFAKATREWGWQECLWIDCTGFGFRGLWFSHIEPLIPTGCFDKL